jgi:hypothetical protein
VVAFVAAVLQKLLGAAGTLLAIIFLIMVGSPSSGGATGVPYLPTIWRDIGSYLPLRGAYILLHDSIYFNGHGITQALTILLIYFGVAATILGILDWRHTEASGAPCGSRRHTTHRIARSRGSSSYPTMNRWKAAASPPDGAAGSAEVM